MQIKSDQLIFKGNKNWGMTVFNQLKNKYADWEKTMLKPIPY